MSIWVITLVAIVILIGVTTFIAKMIGRKQFMDHEVFDSRVNDK